MSFYWVHGPTSEWCTRETPLPPPRKYVHRPGKSQLTFCWKWSSWLTWDHNRTCKYLRSGEWECSPSRFNKREGWRGGKPTSNKLKVNINLWRKHVRVKFSFMITATLYSLCISAFLLLKWNKLTFSSFSTGILIFRINYWFLKYIFETSDLTTPSWKEWSDWNAAKLLQYARPPCPSPTPGVHPNPCPLSRWCHPNISSKHLIQSFSSYPQSFPASGFFFKWVSFSHQVVL